MKYNHDLFGRIAIVALLSSFIHAYILAQIGSNSVLLRIIFVPLFIISGILIGSVIFVRIQKIGHVSFQNKKMINILCIFLAVAIISPAIIEYYIKVPPAEMLKNWKCTGNHELCNEVGLLKIQYINTFEWKSGSLHIINTTHGYDMRDFTWQYDKLSKEITLYEADNPKYFEPKLNGWKIKFKLEITSDKDYYNMITYYINSSGKTPIDAKLFDGVTWTSGPCVERFDKDNTSWIICSP